MIFNNSISSKLSSSIKPALEQLAVTSFGKGIYALGNTIVEWGSSVVSKKDDFQQWFQSFFNIDGIKSGTADLYEKLIAWGKIVYNWFATKFIEFIKNIPKMVKEWDKLRLSLFKWGTFLGGGGGQALWAMFGSGANWDKLGELMGRPDFMDMMNDFNTLVQDNPKAFEELGADGIEDIIEQYLEDPEKAKEATKELIEEQKEKNQEAEKKEEKDPEEKKSEELTAEEIKEKFNSKSGKPKDVTDVLGNMVAQGLAPIHDLPSKSFFGFDSAKAEKLAKEEMNKYIKSLKEEVQKMKNSKKKSPQKEFLDLIGEDKNEELINFLAKVAINAHRKISSDAKFEVFAEQFSKELETQITQPCDGDDCDATDLIQNFKVGNKPKEGN